jgi:hypothetical protein
VYFVWTVVLNASRLIAEVTNEVSDRYRIDPASTTTAASAAFGERLAGVNRLLEEGIAVGFEVLDVCVLLNVVVAENGIAVRRPAWNGA